MPSAMYRSVKPQSVFDGGPTCAPSEELSTISMVLDTKGVVRFGPYRGKARSADNSLA